VLCFSFIVSGSTYGMDAEAMAFYPILVPVFLAAGIYEILKQVHMKKSIAFLGYMMVRIIALPAQDIDSMMGLYAGDFQQEKIYIHFDKSIYNKGETLWFKAYVMAGSEPSGYSKNFYVDWFNDEGKLLSHTASPCSSHQPGASSLFLKNTPAN
jgi:hypothetical protein